MKIVKKLLAFENEMQTSMRNMYTEPVLMDSKDLENNANVRSFQTLCHFARNLQNSIANVDQYAFWSFRGHYHNTAINWTTHWCEDKLNESNIRFVIRSADGFKIELKQCMYEPNTVELFNISVDRKGFGLGTQIMELLKQIAESCDVDLKLVPCYQGETPNVKEHVKRTLRLRKWYESLGFESIDDTAYLVY